MRTFDLPQLQRTLIYSEIIAKMREALIAHSRGDCDTPMPMHLTIEAESAEVHMKASYRRGGKYFALKIASTFPNRAASGMSSSNGMMLLSSAETGDPLAFLADQGHLTDTRTAAVSAMVARELGRSDTVLGIIGTGVQARLQARLHAEVLGLRRIWLWGRNVEHARACGSDIGASLPHAEVTISQSPAEVARAAKLIVTATASREPLLRAEDLQPGTHISAVGADSPGKRELDPEILRAAALLLVDSRRQCAKLGELQHALDQSGRSIEIGAFCESPVSFARDGITVCDFTGLGVEDLYIAEYCYEAWGTHEDRPV